MDEWIAVTERKPNNGQLVLAYHNYNDKFHNDQHMIISRFEHQDYWNDGTITHWMTLPNAPK